MSFALDRRILHLMLPHRHHAPLRAPDLDQIFHALADPTRRSMVERLTTGPVSVSDLAAPHPMSLSAIAQHVQLLQDAGLVRSTKVGRVRIVELSADALDTAERWFSAHRARWGRRFDRLGLLLAEEPARPPSTQATRAKRRKKP